MSDHDTRTTTNTAGDGATVGIQGGEVHNSTVYITSPQDPPERIYQVGVSYLTNGVPGKARELINDALARGHVTTEVRVHWALAMLSKRSYRELDAYERTELARLSEHRDPSVPDEWMRALEVVCELVAHLEHPGGETASTMAKLRNLPPRQREKIEQHCDLVLTGGMKDALWAETRDEAGQHQRAGDRGERVWAFFKPDPAQGRVRQPAPISTSAEDHVRAVVAAVLLAGALGYIGWLLLHRALPLPVFAYIVLLAGGAAAARAGFEWRYRTERLRDKEREIGYFAHRDAPEGGFANRVDDAFGYWARRYAPDGVDLSAWLAKTRGIRTALRDEVVELYREDRIGHEKITWLIRHLLDDIRQRWSNNVLFAHRWEYRTPLSTKAWCLGGIAVGAAAACEVALVALGAAPLSALAAVCLAVGTGRAGTLRWWHIVAERRRFREQTQERARELEARQAAYQRWKDRLDATRPEDAEMEAWLRCDRVMLIEEALRHYRLAWRDITAHTIVQTPARGAKRARVRGGPWRHSKYELRLFLLTADGVRELARQLDVEKGRFHGRERGHFRFDAVSSLRVVESGTCNYTLELTLSNGPARTIEVSDPDSSPGDTNLADEPERISLDSIGFAHALHVLEGIAAEGKAWLHHDTARSRHHRTAPDAETAADPPDPAARTPQRIL